MDSVMQQLLSDIPAATDDVGARLAADFNDGNNPRVPMLHKLPREIHNRVKLAGRISDGTPRTVKDLFAKNLESSLQKNGYNVTVKYKWRSIEIVAA